MLVCRYDRLSELDRLIPLKRLRDELRGLTWREYVYNPTPDTMMCEFESSN